MNQKKNHGFTLIELLAVIVILAIIALIAVPVIMNIISKANESAFKDTAYGVISAGELYFAEQQLEPNGMTSDVTITLPDTTKTLQIKGEVPTGTILITTEGKVAIAVHNNRYCVTKGIDDKDITVTEDIANCNLPSGEVNPPEGGDLGGNTPQAGSLTSLATTSTEVPTKPDCVTNKTTCTPGTPVAIKVNANDVYNFYVIADYGNEVTLIMDRNLGDNVEWYADANDNSHGPTKALEQLAALTNDWEIPEFTYQLSGLGEDETTQSYPDSQVTAKARLITYSEANAVGCTTNSCPDWMYVNLKNTGSDTDSVGNNKNGYWTSTASAIGSYGAWIVRCYGNLGSNATSYTYYGVRPVIELSK